MVVDGGLNLLTTEYKRCYATSILMAWATALYVLPAAFSGITMIMVFLQSWRFNPFLKMPNSFADRAFHFLIQYNAMRESIINRNRRPGFSASTPRLERDGIDINQLVHFAPTPKDVWYCGVMAIFVVHASDSLLYGRVYVHSID